MVVAMTQLLRLRIELPDRPGTLAHVASVLSRHGGNVAAVDIHELEGEAAVDEIVVEVPEDWEPSQLVDDLAAAGATLLSAAPELEVRDPIVTALGWASALLASRAHDSDLELGRAVMELTSASAAWVCSIAEAVRFDAGRLALERGAPVVQRTDEPIAGADGLAPPVWLLAVPDGQLGAGLVAFAARPVNVRFTASEIARVEALLVLRRQLAGLGAVPAAVRAEHW
jgi:hypothetical protein